MEGSYVYLWNWLTMTTQQRTDANLRLYWKLKARRHRGLWCKRFFIQALQSSKEMKVQCSHSDSHCFVSHPTLSVLSEPFIFLIASDQKQVAGAPNDTQVRDPPKKTNRWYNRLAWDLKNTHLYCFLCQLTCKFFWFSIHLTATREPKQGLYLHNTCCVRCLPELLSTS